MTYRDLSISVVIWILSSDTEKWFFCPNGLLCPFGQKNHWFGRGAAEQKTILVWNGPKGSTCSLLNPFGPLCNVDKPSMLGHFWSKVDHFRAIPTPQSWTVDPRVKKSLSPGLFCIAYLQNPNTPRLKHKCGRNLWKMSQKKGQNSMRKWPFFAIILLWMASYGSEKSFLLIFSARERWSGKRFMKISVECYRCNQTRIFSDYELVVQILYGK